MNVYQNGGHMKTESKTDLPGAILTGANLNGVTWKDGAKCKTPSIGQCNK